MTTVADNFGVIMRGVRSLFLVCAFLYGVVILLESGMAFSKGDLVEGKLGLLNAGLLAAGPLIVMFILTSFGVK